MVKYVAVKDAEEDWNLGRIYNLDKEILIQTKAKSARMTSLKEMREEQTKKLAKLDKIPNIDSEEILAKNREVEGYVISTMENRWVKHAQAVTIVEKSLRCLTVYILNAKGLEVGDRIAVTNWGARNEMGKKYITASLMYRVEGTVKLEISGYLGEAKETKLDLEWLNGVVVKHQDKIYVTGGLQPGTTQSFDEEYQQY